MMQTKETMPMPGDARSSTTTDPDDVRAKAPNISREELAWAAANLPRIRRWVSGPYFIREALIYAFVLGLAAHIGGYVLSTMVTGEPLQLLAHLFATLGTTVWTGVVLVIFVQVLPDARRRYAARRLEAYEAALRDRHSRPR